MCDRGCVLVLGQSFLIVRGQCLGANSVWEMKLRSGCFLQRLYLDEALCLVAVALAQHFQCLDFQGEKALTASASPK